jgi:hypothetical protein
MFRYLRTMALPTVQHAAPVMLQSGRYTFLNTPDDLPDQVSDETRRLAAPITPTATPSPPPTKTTRPDTPTLSLPPLALGRTARRGERLALPSKAPFPHTCLLLNLECQRTSRRQT